MPTDTERREVARRLRELDDSELQVYDMTYFAIQCAVGGDSEPYLDGRELTDRLADLIEPSEPKVMCVAEVKVDGERLEKLAHDAAVELTGIDRDALLELTDEMDAYTECDDERCGKEMPPSTIHDFARRIREALGVSE